MYIQGDSRDVDQKKIFKILTSKDHNTIKVKGTQDVIKILHDMDIYQNIMIPVNGIDKCFEKHDI